MREINTWLDDDSLALPYIWPEEITADGGMDFRSTVFADACLAYGISLNLAAPGSPTDKPHVERAFRTIREGFTQYLAGYTGGEVTNRGKLDDPVWTMEALDLLFAMWVSTVYLNTPSDALRDPSRPDLTWTPNQWYAALFRVSAGLPIPFSAEDYIALMPVEKRTIQADGVHIDNHVYDSRGLNGLRKLRSNAADGKWEVRRHPYNPAAVWLRHPETGEWIECVDKALNWVNTPFLTDATAHRPDAQARSSRPDPRRRRSSTTSSCTRRTPAARQPAHTEPRTFLSPRS
ncbi:Mu transposase C-terminal domain-containing protein [Microbacterium aurum]